MSEAEEKICSKTKTYDSLKQLEPTQTTQSEAREEIPKLREKADGMTSQLSEMSEQKKEVRLALSVHVLSFQH